jgi:hypothetical protein
MDLQITRGTPLRHYKNNKSTFLAEQEFLDHMNNFQLSDSVSLFSAPISTAVGVSIQPPPSLLEYLPLAVLGTFYDIE